MLTKITYSRLAGILLTTLLLCAPRLEAKINVVATTPDLAAIAREIGDKHISVISLAKPTEDPHFVDAKPSFILKLNKAEALIEGGAELESGWLPVLIDSSRNPKIAAGAPGHISCSQGVAMLEVPAELDRSKGDIHAMGNPHFMTDPGQARHAAEMIAAAFQQLDGANADYYQSRLKQFITQLDQHLVQWQQQLAPFHGMHVVAFHNTWPYFARRFDLKIDLFLEPKPGIPPSPAHLAKIIGQMRENHARVIIMEPYQNRKTAETVATDTQARVLELAQYPGGIKGVEDNYFAWMDAIVSQLAKALGEKP